MAKGRIQGGESFDAIFEEVAGVEFLCATLRHHSQEDRTLIMEFLRGKRIVFIFFRLDLGGAERQGFLLARHLKNCCGATMQVVGLKGEPGKLAEMCEDAGIPCRSLRLGSMRTRLEWLRALLRFVWLVRRERPDLLVSYTRNANILTALAWRASGALGFVWNQADEGLGMGREFINRLAVSLTPRFISNSTGGRSFLLKCYGISEERVTVIHNGIALVPPVATPQQWREQNGLSNDQFLVCMVANISRFKDHATLLKAWQIVVKSETSRRPVLLLAGRFDGPECELIQLADELQLGNSIRFLGGVADISGLLEAIDLFVYCSKSEGLPNAVVEAMAAGLPVVGTDIPGIREAVGLQGLRFLAPPGDAAGLARIILQLMADPYLCQQYGEGLRNRAETEFSLQAMLDSSEKYFADFMESRGSGRLQSSGMTR